MLLARLYFRCPDSGNGEWKYDKDKRNNGNENQEVKKRDANDTGKPRRNNVCEAWAY